MKTLKVKAGVPQKMDPDQNPTFERWITICDRMLMGYRGLSIYDLPDMRWRDWYDARLRPVRAVNRAIRKARSF